jgi:benzodiazapine receptor
MDQPEETRNTGYLRERAYDQISSPTIDSSMPYVWTTTDTRNVALASIVPVGLGIASSLGTLEGGRYRRHLERSNKPSWGNYDAALFSHMDLITLSPLGYASYLVFKNGGGFDYTDTTTALGLYGASMILVGATVPLLDQGSHKGLAVNSALLAATAAATFVAFRKIDERASWFALPFAVWSLFQAALNIKLYQMNSREV